MSIWTSLKDDNTGEDGTQHTCISCKRLFGTVWFLHIMFLYLKHDSYKVMLLLLLLLLLLLSVIMIHFERSRSCISKDVYEHILHESSRHYILRPQNRGRGNACMCSLQICSYRLLLLQSQLESAFVIKIVFTQIHPPRWEEHEQGREYARAER